MKSAKFFRTISALLSLVLVFTLISTPCSIVRAESLPEVEASETVAEQVNPSTEYKSTDNEAYTELIEDRTADSKVYQL